MNRSIKLLIPILIGATLFFIPAPQGVDAKGWSLFAIFVSTIVGIILSPYPMGAVSLMGMVAAILAGTLTIEESLSGFGKPIMWLIVCIFFIARGFIKSQLGIRIAYLFVRMLGKKTLGLGYGLILTEMIIAPFIPSNASRTGGIMLPILKSISEALGSSPSNNTERRLGSFLTQVCFHGNLITSSMFLTAMAANPLAQTAALKFGIEITWLGWFKAALVPGLVSAAIVPLVLYFIYPPEQKTMPEAVNLAKTKLHEMGPMSQTEWIMAGIFSLMLVLWVAGDTIGINPTLVALIGLCLIILTGVIEWSDVLKETEAWHTLFWLSILITLSSSLEKFGLIGWFSQSIGSHVSGLSWEAAFISLVLVYFFSHVFFASNTAHVSAMYAAFLGVCLAAGTPPLLAALVLGFSSSLFSSTTHYGTGSAVILYGANFVPLSAWWGCGWVISFINIAIWLFVGGMWWKVLGLW
jgi:DASS family divalent anion:Na+ symporter